MEELRSFVTLPEIGFLRDFRVDDILWAANAKDWASHPTHGDKHFRFGLTAQKGKVELRHLVFFEYNDSSYETVGKLAKRVGITTVSLRHLLASHREANAKMIAYSQRAKSGMPREGRDPVEVITTHRSRPVPKRWIRQKCIKTVFPSMLNLIQREHYSPDFLFP